MTEFGGSYDMEIEAPVERCFSIAADIERAPEWQGSMKAARALEHHDDGRPSLVETQVDALVGSAKLTLRFSYEQPFGIEWQRESGDLKWLRGSWLFEEIGDGLTLATYSLEFDPGRVLSMLARGPVVDKVRDHLGARPPEGLKRVAENGTF